MQASWISRSITPTGIVTSVVSLSTLMVSPLPAICNPPATPSNAESPGQDLPGPGNDTQDQVSRRSAAHRVSWCRDDSCSLRSTDDTWLSTVFTEMYSSRAISLYV